MRPDRFPYRFTLGWQLAAALALSLGTALIIGKANTPVNALGRLACVAALIPRNEPGEPGAAFKASG